MESISPTRLSGIVEPTTNTRIAKYQIVTDQGRVLLDIPDRLETIFAKRKYESFELQGDFSAQNVFRVHRALMEPEFAPLFGDRGKSFDLDRFRRAIERGFTIEPRFDEAG